MSGTVADHNKTTGLVYLGMYDRPETRTANDALWAGIRARLGRGPATLTRDIAPMTCWLSPDLVLGQTCGYPFRARLHGKVALVGTPDYGLPGCAPGYYRSVFLTHQSSPRDLQEFAGKSFAYNESLSQSGWAAPLLHMERGGVLPGTVRKTGGHLHSAMAVAEGRVDFTALDAVSWRLMQKYDGFSQNLVAIAETDPTPGLPFIAAAGSDTDLLFNVVSDTVKTLEHEPRNTLMLNGFTHITTQEYLAVSGPRNSPGNFPETE